MSNFSLDDFSKNPVLYLLLLLVLGSSGLDINTTAKQTDALHAQSSEIQQLRYRIDTISSEIGDNSERIARNEGGIDENSDLLSELRYQISLVIRDVDDIQKEMEDGR